MQEEIQTYTAKDFASDQEVKWCPGCGDYSILKQVQSILPEIGIKRENMVFVSGIGCSSRFPYYMNTYGIHSIHGRAPAVATGIKLANPELNVWIITGDGDGLSIGGNHFIHLMRRNLDVNILLFNNEIYGLTKGQFSPTSQLGLKTKSSPFGVIDQPFNPLSLALGSGATFVSRTLDREPKSLREVLLEAQKHKGTSFVEIYQNCVIFNDGVFDEFTNKATKEETNLYLENGKPLKFGKDLSKGIILENFEPKIIDITEDTDESKLWIHDETSILKAQILARFNFDEEFSDFPRPFGVFYKKNRASYEETFTNQVEKNKPDMQQILNGNITWTV
ncbi:MAG: 2-oxoacid:ferredoxin oxidoreductase subunit beta [Flavobacteriaceae bacterium]|nr:2-oxoacid:ferredoxin oxidoreductase subunit beta [Flavobacteriaceae bacterium]